jgi:Fe2+ or Zn2+ uptake regulation protein
MGVTRQRKTILEIISDSRRHLTVEQVYEKARQSFPNIAKGTVYRNLNILADERVIKRLQLPGQPVRFDAKAVAHQHLVCVNCGSIADIDDVDPAELKRLAKPYTEIVDHDLLIYVVCGSCSS